MLTINHTQVPNTDQTNFPYLFNTTDPLLATTAYNGHVASPNGYDIIFTSDAAGQNILNYEMEEYNPATGQVVVWVKIPLLSHTQDTVIYVWYGNASITTLQSQPSSAWDSRFKGVWHFRNGTTLSTNDSTANGNNGTNYGAIAAPGQINEGASFNENSNYVDVGNLGNFPTQGTIEFWMQPSSLSSYPNAFSTNYNGGNDAIRFEEDSSGDFDAIIGNGNFNGYALMAGTMQSGAWYHIALTWDSISSNAIGYVNGAQVFNTNSSNLWPATIPDLAIGSGFASYRDWNGLIDEARISTAARSADWVATEYNNESSPSTFYTLYPENTVKVVPTPRGDAYKLLYATGVQMGEKGIWKIP